jgi:hemoglobin-like flavoprotein
MTPEQIRIVERTLELVRDQLVTIADEFYERLFEAQPGLRSLFTSDPADQHRKFSEQLNAIGCAIRDHDMFTADAAALGLRHQTYGVRPGHYALAGPPLISALASALGERWTHEVETAWLRAYNLIVEMMMAGAAEHPAAGR